MFCEDFKKGNLIQIKLGSSFQQARITEFCLSDKTAMVQFGCQSSQQLKIYSASAWEQILPIDLNVTVLKKFGFIQELQNLYIKFQNGANDFIVQIKDGVYSIYREGKEDRPKEIKYVHQLQNFIDPEGKLRISESLLS